MSEEFPDVAVQKEPTTFDGILSAVGEFGTWQKMLFFFVSLIGIMTGMNTLGQVFMAGEVDHWCRVASWDEANCTTGRPNDWECLLAKRNASIPLIVTNKNTGEEGFDSCHMYDVRKVDFTPGMNATHFTDNIIECPNGWVFDSSQYVTTIISEVGLNKLNEYIIIHHVHSPILFIFCYCHKLARLMQVSSAFMQVMHLYLYTVLL